MLLLSKVKIFFYRYISKIYPIVLQNVYKMHIGGVLKLADMPC